MFMKNLAMMGGAILVAYFGAGPWSVTGVQGGDSGRFQIEDFRLQI